MGGAGTWSTSCALPGPVSTVKVDDAGTPEKGVAGLRKLALEDKVAGVIGQIHSAVMLALGPIADQLKIPVFSSTASSTDISNAHLQYTFQAHAITSDRAAAVGQYIIDNKDKYKKVAIVSENTDYGLGNVKDLEAKLKDVAGLTVKDWIFDKAIVDLSPLLLQVKAFDPDLIFNVSSNVTEYLMVKQATDAGLLPQKFMVISDDRPIRQEFWDNVGDRGNGIAFVTYYHPQQKLSAAGQWFQTEYVKRFGEPPIYTAFQGFGNTIILAQAINQACSTDGPALSKILETGKFMNWNATGVNFPQAAGVDWHRLNIPILMLQYTAANQNYANAKILFPKP